MNNRQVDAGRRAAQTKDCPGDHLAGGRTALGTGKLPLRAQVMEVSDASPLCLAGRSVSGLEQGGGHADQQT